MTPKPIEYCGVTLIPSAYVEDFNIIKRTWKERLFSLPWKPFMKTKTIPEKKMYKAFDNCYFCSYNTYNELLKVIK